MHWFFSQKGSCTFREVYASGSPKPIRTMHLLSCKRTFRLIMSETPKQKPLLWPLNLTSTPSPAPRHLHHSPDGSESRLHGIGLQGCEVLVGHAGKQNLNVGFIRVHLGCLFWVQVDC